MNIFINFSKLGEMQMTTKFDLVTFYSEFNKIKDFEESEEKIDRFLETLEKALKTDKRVVFKMFGSFELKETKERENY